MSTGPVSNPNIQPSHITNRARLSDTGTVSDTNQVNLGSSSRLKRAFLAAWKAIRSLFGSKSVQTPSLSQPMTASSVIQDLSQRATQVKQALQNPSFKLDVTEGQRSEFKDQLNQALANNKLTFREYCRVVENTKLVLPDGSSEPIDENMIQQHFTRHMEENYIQNSDGDVVFNKDAFVSLFTSVQDEISASTINMIAQSMGLAGLTEISMAYDFHDVLQQSQLTKSTAKNMLMSNFLSPNGRQFLKTSSQVKGSHEVATDEQVQAFQSNPSDVEDLVLDILSNPSNPEFSDITNILADQVGMLASRDFLLGVMTDSASPKASRSLTFLDHVFLQKESVETQLMGQKESLTSQKDSQKALLEQYNNQLSNPDLSDEERSVITAQKRQCETSLTTIRSSLNQTDQALSDVGNKPFFNALNSVSQDVLEQVSQLDSASFDERQVALSALTSQPPIGELPKPLPQLLFNTFKESLGRSTHVDDITANIHSENQHDLQGGCANLNDHAYFVSEFSRGLHHIALRTPDGQVAMPQSVSPDLHMFNVLKPLVEADPTLDNSSDLVNQLRQLCFKTGGDYKAKIDTFLRQLPLNSHTMQSLSLITQSLSAPVCSHMCTGPFGADSDSVAILENGQSRFMLIDLDPENPQSVTVQTRLNFEEFKSTDDIQNNTPLHSMESVVTNTLTFHSDPAQRQLSTSFKLGQCVNYDPASASSFDAKVSAWNGAVVSQSIPSPDASKSSPLTHLKESKVLSKQFDALQKGVTKAHQGGVSKSRLLKRCAKFASTLMKDETIDQFSKHEVLTSLRGMVNQLESAIKVRHDQKLYQGVKLRYLFTSQSIYREQHYNQLLDKVSALKDSLTSLQFSSALVQDSDTEHSRLITGDRGQQFQMMGILSNDEVEALKLTENIQLNTQDITPDGDQKFAFLGQGAQKLVYLARNVDSGEIVACSRIFLHDDEMTQEFMHEVQVGMSIAGPDSKTAVNVLDHAILDAPMEGMEGFHYGYTFETLGRKSGSDLMAGLQELGPDEKINQFNSITSQLLAGVDEMHQKGIYHYDIKPDNFVQSGDGRIRLIDFGTAVRQDCIETSSSADRAKFVEWGSTLFNSPDILSGQELMALSPQDQEEFIAKRDSWALGVTLYQLFSSKMPFNIDEFMGSSFSDDFRQHIQNNPLDLSEIPQPFHQCLEGLLTVDFRQRSSVSEARAHLNLI